MIQFSLFQVLLLFSKLLCSHGENNGLPTLLYVTPNANVSCPVMPCLTLSQYVENQDVYFGTDTELRFLSGVHRLSNPIVIEGDINSTKLVLVGEALDKSEIVILTREQSSLKLVEMKSIRIESLQFSGISILVENSSSITMNDLQFTAMNESAFDFQNIGSITGVNITMTKLSGDFSAGVIRLCSGIITNVTVESNTASSILVIEESFVHFKEISTFVNNSAIKGSTLVMKTSAVTFNGSVLFQSNRCKNKGGAMSIVNSTVIFFGQIELSDNSAGDGGAIQLSYSILKMNGLVDVSNNRAAKRVFGGKRVSGGAINSIQSNITMTGTVTFRRNRIHAPFLVGFGGAISAQKSIIMLSDTIICFHNNAAVGLINYGGAILLTNSTLVAINTMLTFTNNRAQNGGAIAITAMPNFQFFKQLQTSIKVEGTSIFDANAEIGSDLYGEYQVMYIRFSGNTTMSRNRGQKVLTSSQVFILQTTISEIQFHGNTEIKNSYSTGMIIYFRGNVCALFSGVTKFTNNTGLRGGLQVLHNASITFVGRTYFQGNYGILHSVITLDDSKPPRPSMISGEVQFLDNDSGISLSNSEIKFEGTFNFTRNGGSHRFGCVLTVLFESTAAINGTMLMNLNTADTGPAVYSHNSSIKIDGVFNASNNFNGAVFSIRSRLYFNGNISFISNSASSRGGAIWAIDSQLFLSGYHVYSNNTASAGGVFSLGMSTVFHFNDLAIVFRSNRAEKGAIFHYDDVLNAVDCLADSDLSAPLEPLSVRTECFFTKPNNVNVTNIGNIASEVGNIIFGGNLERCNRENAAETFINLFHTDDSIRNITSNPYQIVFCKNDIPIIISSRLLPPSSITVNTIPGKLFSLSVAGLNQLLKPIASIIRAEISTKSNTTARLGSFQGNQQVSSDSCAELSYRIFTQAPSIYLTLYAEGPCNKLGTAAKEVKIELERCPDGFELVGDECACEVDLLKYTTACNVDDESIQNGGTFWAGGLYDDNGSYVGIMSFPNCPFDYCKKEMTNFTLLDPDLQCAHNRSGIICGQCRVNYSLTLGEVQCSDCSRISSAVAFGLLLLFALIGIFIVIFLILLKMTVASGTLNGLIFYANIVDANRAIFVPQAGWVRVFISWLNLDFGFSTCFYSGTDMYGYTWLQFIFPFYIWMLIVILIVISRRSAWVTKRVGSNPVAVLATLILLSYAKLLRTVITVFYFATLQLPHGQTSTVWLYDGNIPYLRGKHLVLFIFALLFFLLLFLPYNFLLMVGPWIQNISGERINDSKLKALIRKVLVGWYEDYRIKSFVDTYTVAYTPQHQYWTGIFLMLRFILFLVFATSAFRNSSTTLMAVTTSLLAVTTFTRTLAGQIYKSWGVDVLEGLFLLNLGILSVATSHNMMTGGNQQLVANISIGISLVLFLLIVAYHAFKQISSTDLYDMIYMKLKRKYCPEMERDDQQAQLLSHLIDNSQELAPMTTIISIPSST